jgi:hypothetical protein
MPVSSDGVALGLVPALRAGLVSVDVWLSLAKSGGVGPWFGPGLPDLPVKEGSIKALRIMDDGMTLEIDNRVVATASVLRGLAIGAGKLIRETADQS